MSKPKRYAITCIMNGLRINIFRDHRTYKFIKVAEKIAAQFAGMLFGLRIVTTVKYKWPRKPE